MATTTFGILATLPSTPISVPTVTPKRNRHSVENDQQSALIKRINRLYARLGTGVDRKVCVIDGTVVLTVASTGEILPSIPGGSLQELLSILLVWAS